MAQYKMRAPDGNTYTVDGPDGATEEQVRAEIVRQNPSITNAPSAPPPGPLSPAGPLMSSPKGFYGPGLLANLESRLTGSKTPEQAYEQRVPQLEKTAGVLGSLLAPGSSVLKQMGSQALVGAGGEALRGTGPEAAVIEGAKSAAGAGVLGGLAKGAKTVLSGTRLPGFASDVSNQLVTKLQETVPAWAKMKNLKDMLYSQEGFNSLHTAYEKSLADVVKRGAGKMIQIPLEAAEQLGLKGGGGSDAAMIAKMLGARPGQALNLPGVSSGAAAAGHVMVDAGQAAQAMTGKSGTPAYRLIARALDDADIGDPVARGAYRTATGLKEYLNKQGAMTPGGLDIMKAQSGLVGKNADVLLKRQLGPIMDILAPGGQLVEKGNLAKTGGIVGGVLGGAGGAGVLGPFGGMGGLPGAYYGTQLGKKIPTYTGVPQGPLGNLMQLLAPRLGGATGALARPTARSTEAE